MTEAGAGAPSLAGVTVLVTRPAGQGDGLAALVEHAGGQPVSFPVTAIQPLPAAAATADACDVVIFVSRNAVAHGGRILETLASAEVAAVGEGTAAALRAAGVPVGVVPTPGDGYNSEGLLAQPALAAPGAGRRVLLVRGEGGRTLLADTLRARGWRVEHAVVYRRCVADSDPGVLEDLRTHAVRPVVVLTSADGVANLFAIAGSALRRWLCTLRYVAIGARVARALDGLCPGVRVVVAASADDEGLLRALLCVARAAHANTC